MHILFATYYTLFFETIRKIIIIIGETHEMQIIQEHQYTWFTPNQGIHPPQLLIFILIIQ